MTTKSDGSRAVPQLLGRLIEKGALNHCAVMAHQDEDVQIRASLETLAHQVSENWHQQLRTLRAALDRQLSSIEAALDEAGNSASVDATIKHLSHAAAERADHARKQAEAAASQALAAIETELRARVSSEIATSTTLRASLEEAKKALESAQNKVARAEAAQRATSRTAQRNAERPQQADDGARERSGAGCRAAGEVEKRPARGREQHVNLAAAQQQVLELSAERADLLDRVKSVTAAKSAAEAQCRQLEAVSQKLSGALSQMLRDREPGRPAVV